MLHTKSWQQIFESNGPQVFTGFTVLVGAIAGFWLGLPSLTRILIGLMAIDIILGLMLALNRSQLSVRRSFQGITKKVVVGLLIGVAAMFNEVMEPIIKFNLVQAVSAGYCAHELVSIFDNARKIGVPVPRELERLIDYLRAQQDARDVRQDKRTKRQDKRDIRQDIREDRQDTHDA